jgi:hypothetical protein
LPLEAPGSPAAGVTAVNSSVVAAVATANLRCHAPKFMEIPQEMLSGTGCAKL